MDYFCLENLTAFITWADRHHHHESKLIVRLIALFRCYYLLLFSCLGKKYTRSVVGRKDRNGQEFSSKIVVVHPIKKRNSCKLESHKLKSLGLSVRYDHETHEPCSLILQLKKKRANENKQKKCSLLSWLIASVVWLLRTMKC